MEIELQFDKKYFIRQNDYSGSWFRSSEEVPDGTIRMIQDAMFYATMIEGFACWFPVEKDDNNHLKREEFIGFLADKFEEKYGK